MANKNPKIYKATQFRTGNEQVKNAKKAGIKSGEVRRAKKELKEQLQIAIDIYTKKLLNDPNITEEQKEILKSGSDILVLELIQTALNKKVKHETRLKANDMIMDRMYGKPKQTIDGDVGLNIESITFKVER